MFLGEDITQEPDHFVDATVTRKLLTACAVVVGAAAIAGGASAATASSAAPSTGPTSVADIDW